MQFLLLTSTCCFEAASELSIGKTHEGGFVEIVDDLTVEACAIDLDAIEEVIGLDDRADDAGHEVLDHFEREKYRISSRFGDQWPEEADHVAREAAEGGDGHLGAGLSARIAHLAIVGKRESLLRYEDENRMCGNSGGNQVTQPVDTGSCLARACDSFKEDPALNGRFDDG